MNSRAGFTLFEVIVAAAVLSVGLLMIVQIFPLGLRAKEAAEQCSTAALLGQQMMEEIKRKGYDDLSAAYPSEADSDRKDSVGPSIFDEASDNASSEFSNGVAGYGVGEGKFKEYKGYRYRLEWWDTSTPYLRKVKVRILYGGRRMSDEDEYEDDEDESGWRYLEFVTYLAKKD